jgi:peptidoglycan/xylan/chitin deacetylase (PgdA/CDA1 family)
MTPDTTNGPFALRSRVPVLMYHRLFADPAELAGWRKAVTRHWVAVPEFERQVRALADRGYRPVPLTALLPGAERPRVGKPIVITFDDGWASDHRHARPILERLGWRSEHFVTVGWVGRDAFMSWTQVEEVAGFGAGVHSHSLTHRDLDRLPPREVRHELEASKAALEARLRRRVDFLALPGGTGAGASVRSTARELGYRGICTSRIGLNRLDADPYALRRIPVRCHTPLARLLEWIEGRRLDRLALARETLRLTRALVPRVLYDRLAEVVLR